MTLEEFKQSISELVSESDNTAKLSKADKLVLDITPHLETKSEPKSDNSNLPLNGKNDKSEDFEVLKRYFEEQKKQLDEISAELNLVKSAYSDRFNYGKVEEIQKAQDDSNVSYIDNLFESEVNKNG